MITFNQYFKEKSELESAREVFADIIDDESKVVEDSARQGVDVFSMKPMIELMGTDLGVLVANMFSNTPYKFVTINSVDGDKRTFEKGALTEGKDTTFKTDRDFMEYVYGKDYDAKNDFVDRKKLSPRSKKMQKEFGTTFGEYKMRLHNKNKK